MNVEKVLTALLFLNKNEF